MGTGTLGRSAFSYAFFEFEDTFTISPPEAVATSELFFRIEASGLIQESNGFGNPDFGYSYGLIRAWALFPDGNLAQLTLSPDRYTVVLYEEADGTYREVVNVPVPPSPAGAKILSWGFVEAQAQSSVLNPRVTSSTRFALCSRDPSHEITSLAGARGGCPPVVQDPVFRWVRYDRAQPAPTTIDEAFASGTSLLAGHSTTGLKVALLSDWYLAYTAEFQCTGRHDQWEVRWGASRWETYVYDANCDFHAFENGSLVQSLPNRASVQAWAGLPLDCQQQLNSRQHLTFWHNGHAVTPPIEPNPEVLSGGGRVSLATTDDSLDVHLPDETTLPTGRALKTLCPVPNCPTGFDDPGALGQRAAITVSVRDSRCEDGSPFAASRITPLVDVPLVTRFSMKAGAGGHSHQTSDTSAAEPLSGSPQRLLSVFPARGSFVASSGIWTARTDAVGELHATVGAGEVSGHVETTVMADPDFNAGVIALSIFAPGAVLEEPAPLTLAVRFVPPAQVLREIEPQPGLYNLVNGSPPDHDSNHWIDPLIQGRIIGMATAFKLDYPFTDDGIPATYDPDLLLNIDDASLVDGGLFDTNGTYSHPHEFHRTGHDLDIPSSAFDFANGLTSSPLPPGEILTFGVKSFIFSHGGAIYYEPQIHVRFP